jgi:hypothetical protein
MPAWLTGGYPWKLLKGQVRYVCYVPVWAPSGYRGASPMRYWWVRSSS